MDEVPSPGQLESTIRSGLQRTCQTVPSIEARKTNPALRITGDLRLGPSAGMSVGIGLGVVVSWRRDM